MSRRYEQLRQKLQRAKVVGKALKGDYVTQLTREEVLLLLALFTSYDMHTKNAG